MIRGVLSVVFVVSISASSSLAEAPAPDDKARFYPPSLVELTQRVLNNHPFLTASQEEIEGARGELLSNQGAFDPVLKGEFSNYPKGDYSGTYTSVFAEQPLEWMGSKIIAGYRRGGGTFPVYEDYYDTNENGEARVGFEIPLLRDRSIDRRRASIQRATVQITGANLTLNQRQIELVRSATIAFWEWAAAKKKYKAFQDLLKVAEERDKQLVERVSAGDFSEFDRNDNLRQVLQRKTLLVAADRARQNAEYLLSLFIWNRDGTPDATFLQSKSVILPDPPRLSPDNAKVEEEQAVRSRPDVARLVNQIEQQRIERELAQNQILPRLDVAAYGSDDSGDQSTSKDEAELKLGVKIEIPLETRTQRGRLDVIAAKEREITQQKILTEQRIRIEIADARNAFEAALQRVGITRNELRLAQELQAGEKTKLEQGDSNLIFLNLREQATTDAVVREVDAVADAWKAYASYRAALGEK